MFLADADARYDLTVRRSQPGSSGEKIQAARGAHDSPCTDAAVDLELGPPTETFGTATCCMTSARRHCGCDSAETGALDAGETRILQMHTTLGEHLLAFVPFVWDLAHDVITYHHERWDGCGYPWGLRGEPNPLAARIFAVPRVRRDHGTTARTQGDGRLGRRSRRSSKARARSSIPPWSRCSWRWHAGSRSQLRASCRARTADAAITAF